MKLGDNPLPGCFLNFGHPISNPMTIRGVGFIELNDSFYIDNIDNIQYASIVDIGGLKFGHINDPVLRENIYDLNLNPYVFYELAKEAFSSKSKNRIFLTKAIEHKLLHIFGSEITKSIIRCNSPNARIFEFQLNENGFLKESHINKLLLANHYKNEVKHKKVCFYNSKYCFSEHFS